MSDFGFDLDFLFFLPVFENAVGKRQALHLALTAELIDAARAAEIGLVH